MLCLTHVPLATQPENVLLLASGHAVLTDFDLSFCATSRPFMHMLPSPDGVGSLPILVRCASTSQHRSDMRLTLLSHAGCGAVCIHKLVRGHGGVPVPRGGSHSPFSHMAHPLTFQFCTGRS